MSVVVSAAGHEPRPTAPGTPARMQVRVPLLTRLFVWSVVLEPLLFFVLFERAQTGITGNLSRILQAMVVAVLLLRGLSLLATPRAGDIRLIDPWSPLYRNYIAYLFVAVAAGLLGAFTGAYDLPVAYEAEGRSSLALILNSRATRPVFEYVVAIYYFAYFVILPRYLLARADALDYFFTVFRRIFVISFVIGIADLFLSAGGIYVLPRHLSEAGEAFTGARFHGLAGEPRQAFSHLLLGLAVFHLAAWIRGRRLSRWWIAAVAAAALLTQSASGLLGLVFFGVLYLACNVTRVSVSRVFWGAASLVLLGTAIFVAVLSSDRILAYLEAGRDLWYVLESGRELPYLVVTQISSIYPVYDLTVKFRELDWLPLVLGSGLGSTSVLNNLIPNAMPVDLEVQLANPNSQLVRTVYEVGLVGTGFFLLSFIRPIAHLTNRLRAADRRRFLFFTLLLLGVVLANRSSASFIYLGLCLAVFRVYGGTGTGEPTTRTRQPGHEAGGGRAKDPPALL